MSTMMNSAEFQEKQMSFQPDFILKFAHYLGDFYKEVENIKMY